MAVAGGAAMLAELVVLAAGLADGVAGSASAGA